MNAMVANPEKNQAIFLDPSRQDRLSETLDVRGADIASDSCVNILGSDIDDKLNFTNHINKICAFCLLEAMKLT